MAGAVKVDVDFLNPIVDSIKKTSRDFWRQLPPDVQRGLPYVAVAFTSSLIVYKWQHRKYSLEVCPTACRTCLLSGHLCRLLGSSSASCTNSPRCSSHATCRCCISAMCDLSVDKLSCASSASCGSSLSASCWYMQPPHAAAPKCASHV